jgi:predicted negative regulator of RcsB-dependent stress response
MAYDHGEQEQLAQFRAWWDRYGNLVLAVSTALLLAVAAYNGWRWYERDQAGRAAAVYNQLAQAVEVKDGAKVKALAGALIDQYGRSVYASMAALYAAKFDHEAGDLPAARARLQWVIAQSGHPEYVPIARLRLAGVQLDEKAYDDALRSLAGEVPAAQAAAFADRRGDVLIAQGKVEEARAAYTEALAKADAAHPLRRVIEIKLDALPAAAA